MEKKKKKKTWQTNPPMRFGLVIIFLDRETQAHTDAHTQIKMNKMTTEQINFDKFLRLVKVH